MLKTATFTYGSITVPTTVVPAQINVQLIDSAGATAQEKNVPYGDATVEFDVPAGTGWMVRVFNKATDGSNIGDVINSAPFDVVTDQTIQVVVGVSVA